MKASRLSLSPLSYCALAAFLFSGVAACSSDDDASEDSTEFPSDTSSDGIAAFLETGAYKSWLSDPAPRSSSDPSNIHGMTGLRVYFNEQAQVEESDGNPADKSMIVKEFYNNDGVHVGTATSLKTAENSPDEWTFFCTNPGGGNRCTGAAETLDPIYEKTNQGLKCSSCHGDFILSPVPQ